MIVLYVTGLTLSFPCSQWNTPLKFNNQKCATLCMNSSFSSGALDKSRHYVRVQLSGLSPLNEAGSQYGYIFLNRYPFQSEHIPFSQQSSSSLPLEILSPKAIPIPLTSPIQRRLCTQALNPNLSTTQPMPFFRSYSFISNLNQFFGSDLFSTSTTNLTPLSRFNSNELSIATEYISKLTSIQMQHAIITESPSLFDQSRNIQLSSSFVVKSRIASIGNSSLFNDSESFFKCPEIPQLVAVCTQLHLPLYIQREIFDSSTIPIDCERGIMNCLFADPSDVKMYQENDDTNQEKSGEDFVEAYELEMEKLERISETELRRILRRCGVATRRSDGKEFLIEQVLPFLDEIERRKYRIQEAVMNQEFGKAQELENGKSDRHIARDKMQKAVEEERFGDAQFWMNEYQWLTTQKADITQEQDAYDPYLDQDPWYRPSN